MCQTTFYPPQLRRASLLGWQSPQWKLTEAHVPSAGGRPSLSQREKVHWYWNVHSKMLLYFWAEDNVLQKELLTLIKAYSKRKYTDAFCQGKKKSAPPSQSLWGKGGAQTHMLHPTLIFSISLHACSGNLFSILQRSIVEKKKVLGNNIFPQIWMSHTCTLPLAFRREESWCHGPQVPQDWRTLGAHRCEGAGKDLINTAQSWPQLFLQL